MKSFFNEDDLEQLSLEWLENLGYEIKHGNDISHIGIASERDSYEDVILGQRLESALQSINPDVAYEAIKQAAHLLTIEQSPSLIENNRIYHEYMTNGIEVEHYNEDGKTLRDIVKVFDFNNPGNNDFLAVKQLVVEKGDNQRIPDIVLYVNGLPLVVIELKNATNESVGVLQGYNQLQTYKERIPQLFNHNAFMVTSDGLNTKVGSLTANYDRFMHWRTKDGETEATSAIPSLEVLITGMLNKHVLLDMLRHFILFQDVGEDQVVKIVAAYHQYYAVNKAVKSTLEASSSEGDGKAGVVWHTQGSGKSLTMVFFSGKLIQEMNNPTIVVLTDRNDLDNQLFGTFSISKGRRGKGLLRQTPKQAESTKDLIELLSVESGGIIFTTMQKFAPEEGESFMRRLSDRKNIVVMADEAHRTQYGFSAKVGDQGEDVKYGYAKYLRDALPNASFVGFTGTPVASTDKNTEQVFGDYIDVYDMTQSVKDGSTVKIYYESRIIPLNLPNDLSIDDDYAEITEGQEDFTKDRLKSKWSRIEALAGSEPRVKALAKDIIEHFETRQQAMVGKGMIVAMSRRIAVELYDEIVRQKPDWHSDDDHKGVIKVVMTGQSSDPQNFQRHIGPKQRRVLLEKRMKDEQDELKLVIVRDMWLTGFDVPSLHTMYVDKPMKGHNLMQAIARVNRVFKDKPGGLIVDYIGIADSLKEALKEYTADDREQTGVNTELAVELMLTKYDVLQDMFYEHDYSDYESESRIERYTAFNNTVNFVLEFSKDHRKLFIDTVTELSRAYALCATEEEAKDLNREIAFFKSVKSGVVKLVSPPSQGGRTKTPAEIDAEVNQLVSKSVVTDEIVDIYETLGLENPDISILSDKFLEDVQALPQKNVAVALLDRLLKGKVRSLMRTNATQSKKFSEMLDNAINQYNKRSIDSSKVIEELIELAKSIDKAQKEGEGYNEPEKP
ncbi:type I restriction enzyme, R subunit [Aliicoccus persicus]|uniref:Type I restriction enzyme endonuclease subunit n=1 Tax=Aliicoccus persicus TaxID=930138 RepID=A0A662Z740_9STAP|nr:type I restriction endonuclease subunit R [Aliicoccus persicus]SEW17399.1 type I restriction enzyme, R subunit [Aliicoccus persicus]